MIRLCLIVESVVYDVPITGFSVTGRKGGAGRSLTADIIDSSAFARVDFELKKGCRCIAYNNDVEIFQGLVVSQSRGTSKKKSITAYDNLIYLANNRDTFSYTNKTASEIFTDLCTQFEISYDAVADTEYVAPSLSIESGTLWDCILEALQSTYTATGERFYVVSEFGKASLIKRVDYVQQWVLAEGSNLTDYSWEQSIDGIATRVKMTSGEGAVYGFAQDAELEQYIGIFQTIIEKDDDLTDGQLQEEIATTLAIESAGTEQLTVSGIGIDGVIAGGAIYVLIQELGVEQSFWIDEDTHDYSGEVHTMSLTLNKTDEF